MFSLVYLVTLFTLGKDVQAYTLNDGWVSFDLVYLYKITIMPDHFFLFLQPFFKHTCRDKTYMQSKTPPPPRKKEIKTVL